MDSDMTALAALIRKEIADTDTRRTRLVAALSALTHADKQPDVVTGRSRYRKARRLPGSINVYLEQVRDLMPTFTTPVKPKALMRKLDMPYSSLFTVLKRLADDGFIVRNKDGYQLIRRTNGVPSR